ncbi:ABC transporter ATP-binding protein [Paenibacillus turpanensis]|uniref:ABC transporter ATP-binding protein n=1 Tax=Paenibacillus turpanensis TaxID=2689078 RepID=UPI00140E65A1|nr:dipeptide ABC transporter ATP-binding protein [Paenibacillus turpanensis]
MNELIEVKGLKSYYPIKRGVLQRTAGYVKAVDDVSFVLREGETLGLVGESGCGKSTLGRTLLQLAKPTDGEVLYLGTDLTKLNQGRLKPYRRELQMIFQDPYASLNGRKTVRDIVKEPLLIHGLFTPQEREERMLMMLEKVGLRAAFADRYPHEFSGGQRQRIGIARALMLRPKVIVADEPVSALDVSVQAQVLNLMQDLQEELALTYLFIAHDLSVVKHISTRVGVMYLGRIVELADKASLYANPQHPYTKSLLSAVPVPNPKAKRERILLKGDIPSPANPPVGCAFHTRCPVAVEICSQRRPELREIAPGHSAACHLI